MSLKKFMVKLAKNNIQVQSHLLNNLLQDISLNPKEPLTDDSILIYKHLVDVIEVFQRCPSKLRTDTNKSKQLADTLEKVPMMKTQESYGKVDELFQHVSNRITEKFKGFTQAFRSFDKNYDGVLNLREFVRGMNEMGINLTLNDYKLLFDGIDFDQVGQIDYFKFCLLDYQKEQQRARLIGHYHNPKFDKGKSEKKHARFMDGRVPKNKDQRKFLEDCYTMQRAKVYLDKKNQIKANHNQLKCAQNLPNDHVFGIPST